MSRPALILYDADCGFCRWTLAWVLRWDRRRALQPVTLRGHADELLASVAPSDRMSSWHLLTESGEVLSGAAAFPELFACLPGGAPFGRLSLLAPRAADRLYRLVAGNRSRLSRFVPAGAVRRADAVIAARQAARAGVDLP